MKSKPRWDQPELMPLRYDYQLLKDCYQDFLKRQDRMKAQRPVFTFALFVAGLALWLVGILAVAMLVQP